MVSKVPVNRSVVIESIPGAVIGICKDILVELKAKNFSEDNIFAVHLALEEAFLNAVKHGNKMDQEKAVKIEYTIGLDKIEVFVTDEGEGFDPEAVPDPRLEENLYKTDGRGLFLIRSYMDEVKFHEQGKCMQLVKYRS